MVAESLDLAIAASTRVRDAGSEVIRTPVASATALRMAGAVGMVAHSPSPLAPNGPAWIVPFDEDDLDVGNVVHGGNPVVGEPSRHAWNELLLEGEPEPHHDGPLDLASRPGRVQHLAHVVRGHHARDADRPAPEVDLDFGHLCG